MCQSIIKRQISNYCYMEHVRSALKSCTFFSLGKCVARTHCAGERAAVVHGLKKPSIISFDHEVALTAKIQSRILRKILNKFTRASQLLVLSNNSYFTTYERGECVICRHITTPLLAIKSYDPKKLA